VATKVCGAIGPLASLGRPSPHVSELQVGIGNTAAWKLNVLDPTTSVAFFYEVTIFPRLFSAASLTTGPQVPQFLENTVSAYFSTHCHCII
jgi:hypothetical protein